jgi:hypothetical protein
VIDRNFSGKVWTGGTQSLAENRGLRILRWSEAHSSLVNVELFGVLDWR